MKRLIICAFCSTWLFSACSGSVENQASDGELDQPVQETPTNPQTTTDASVPLPDGTYTFEMVFAEWRNQSMGETVDVRIAGDSIIVSYAGGGDAPIDIEIGYVLDRGILRQHQSGDWIISDDPDDVNLELIGGCTGGPNVVDFGEKKFRTC